MKRLAVVVLGAFVASLLVLVPGINAGAQEDADEFVINPDSGVPGDLIATAVDPDAVAENCVVLADFNDVYGPLLAAIDDAVGGIPDVDPGNPGTFPTSFEEMVSMIMAGALMPALADSNEAAAILANTYLLTFVDIGTQEPIGEMSSFNPSTGEGTIVVPEELTPGLWAVAAICVEPNLENLPAALAAGVAVLEDELGEFPEGDFAAIGALLGQLPALGEAVAGAVLGELMEPSHTWTAPFTYPVPRPIPSPENEAFCAVLPELQPLGAAITEALANLPEDDEDPSQAEWDAIGAELRELFVAAQELLDEGDENRPDAVAPQWDTVTQGLRDARNALEAVDYDLSTDSGRTVAAQLRDGARDESPNPEGDAATEVLTQWFLDNCVPAAPPAETPVEETPRAAPAPAAAAQPTFAG